MISIVMLVRDLQDFAEGSTRNRGCWETSCGSS